MKAGDFALILDDCEGSATLKIGEVGVIIDHGGGYSGWILLSKLDLTKTWYFLPDQITLIKSLIESDLLLKEKQKILTILDI